MNKMTMRLCTAALAAALAGGAAHAAEFELSSPDVRQMQPIAPAYYWNNFGCSGENMAPRLEWKNPPAGTRSYAVTLHDDDAPTGSGFWHWVVYDIVADADGLAGGKNGGALPAGAVQGNTDLGKSGFFGPCPPVGREHRYRWTLHALKVDKLPVAADASPALVGFILWQNRLAEVSLTVTAGPR